MDHQREALPSLLHILHGFLLAFFCLLGPSVGHPSCILGKLYLDPNASHRPDHSLTSPGHFCVCHLELSEQMSTSVSILLNKTKVFIGYYHTHKHVSILLLQFVKCFHILTNIWNTKKPPSLGKRDKLQFVFATWTPSIVTDIQYVSSNGCWMKQ